ncbi:MAG: class III signal peptide-containing protein, partial [Candidatus Micrarchaeota archaeon]|nr:class III signal peptide-containing protein [Candidatus Micrarchaeota archaeon]
MGVKATRSVRGQGTFEYVLLLGGVLLIVVLALVVLQSTFQDSSTGLSDVQTKKCQAAALAAPSCEGVLDDSRTFDLFGYQINPVLCDCSDYNPDAFSIPVGGGASVAGFSSLAFASFESGSTLYFATTDAFSVSVNLPKGEYAFFTSDGKTVTAVQPVAVSEQADGNLAFSFDELPAGKLKVVPKTEVGRAAQETAFRTRQELPSAETLKTKAVFSQETS